MSRALLSGLAASLIFSLTASAQTVSTARVIRNAAILEQPRGEADFTLPPSGRIDRNAVELLPGQLGPTTAPVPIVEQREDVAPQIARAIPYPRNETTIGWSVLRDQRLSDASDVSVSLGGPSLSSRSRLGLSVATAGNFNHWFGIAIEVGASFFTSDFVGSDIVNLRTYTVMAGPKFTVRSGRVAPYGQFFAGPAYRTAEIPPVGLSLDALDFALQSGGGLDIVLSDTLAVRVGVDGRFIGDNPFRDADRQFRFTSGITFRN